MESLETPENCISSLNFLALNVLNYLLLEFSLVYFREVNIYKYIR